VPSIIGLALIFVGFFFLLVGQITLWRYYSSTLVIREDHQLITHGIYRTTRTPMYLGGIMVVIGLPLYVLSANGFITSLFLIPIVLIRIKLEEKMLQEEFGADFRKYQETT
jgi:protein-S-isoprenylcysteine O-methyltransferase Ste14